MAILYISERLAIRRFERLAIRAPRRLGQPCYGRRVSCGPGPCGLVGRLRSRSGQHSQRHLSGRETRINEWIRFLTMANILLPYAGASQASTSHKANICLPLCTLLFVCWPGPVGLLGHQAVKHAPMRQVLQRQPMRSLRACLPRTDCRLRLGEERPSRRTGEPCDVRRCSIGRCIAFASQGPGRRPGSMRPDAQDAGAGDVVQLRFASQALSVPNIRRRKAQMRYCFRCIMPLNHSELIEALGSGRD